MTPRLRLSFVCLAVLLSLSPADAGTSVTTKNPPVSASAAAPTQHAPDPKRLDLTVGGSIQFELPADAKGGKPAEVKGADKSAPAKGGKGDKK